MAAGRRRRRRTGAWLLSPLLILFGATVVEAQANLQLWGNFTIDWQKADRLTYVFDLEPKVLVSVPPDKPGWWTIDLTPSAEYAVKKWVDLTGEFLAGYTSQSDDVRSVELTPRVGLRFHLFSRGVPVRLAGHVVQDRELPPKRRIVVRDYLRVEWRNLFYSDDTPMNSSARLRNRLEMQFPLNRGLVTSDGARYVLADWEWFVPLPDDVTERFANKQRIRAGLGWRRNREWRFEGLYIWERSLDTTNDGFTTSDNVINLRVKRVF